MVVLAASGIWVIDRLSDNPTSAASETAGAGDTAILKSPSTTNSEAYSWYWRGRGYYDRATGRRPAWALPYFETAATLDPNFALAHASLTVCTSIARRSVLHELSPWKRRSVRPSVPCCWLRNSPRRMWRSQS